MNEDKTYYAVSELSAYKLYEVLCKELSFNTMIELYKLINYKMQFLDDEPRMELSCLKDSDNKDE